MRLQRDGTRPAPAAPQFQPASHTDYYPIIARAVSELTDNNPDARQRLYNYARTTLAAQLNKLDPPISGSQIARERIALEAAICRVEDDALAAARTGLPLASDT
jgi:hypothetical protein